MRFIGEFTAYGGPVCLSSLSAAKEWTGSEEGGDYWNLIKELGNDLVTPYKTGAGREYVFFNMESDVFALFAGPRSLLVVDVINCEADSVIPEYQKGLLANVGRERGKALGFFGGLTVIFAAPLSGRQITRKTTGVQFAHPDRLGPDSLPEIAVVRVKAGKWKVFYTGLSDGQVRLTAALFKAVE